MSNSSNYQVTDIAYGFIPAIGVQVARGCSIQKTGPGVQRIVLETPVTALNCRFTFSPSLPFAAPPMDAAQVAIMVGIQHITDTIKDLYCAQAVGIIPVLIDADYDFLIRAVELPPVPTGP